MKKIIFSLSALALLMTSCFSDDDTSVSQGITGSTISGGTDNAYSFCVGDEAQDLSILVVSEGSGSNSTFILSNGDGEIVALPSTVNDFPSFEKEEVASYSIRQINYEQGLVGLDVGAPFDEIAGGIFVMSNTITVDTEDCRVIAPAIIARVNEDGEENYTFCVDGLEDRATDIEVSFDGIGETGQIVVTDEDGMILGLPGAFDGPNFDEAGVGVCYIWHLNYNGDIEGLTGPDDNGPTANVNDLQGEFALSDFISVIREDCSPTITATSLTAGALASENGEYTFSVGDGTVNNVTDLVVELGTGETGEFVVTDNSGVILGLPGADVSVVDFDQAGVGICYIRYINYNGMIEGLTGPDMDGEPTSTVEDLVGEFKLSNFIVVNRVEESEE